jgi:hypothetical protein
VFKQNVRVPCACSVSEEFSDLGQGAFAFDEVAVWIFCWFNGRRGGGWSSCVEFQPTSMLGQLTSLSLVAPFTLWRRRGALRLVG